MPSWRGVASRARVPISAWPDSPEVAANASRGAGAGDHGRSKFFDRAESMTKSPPWPEPLRRSVSAPQWRHSARPMTVARQSAVGSPRLATTSAAWAQSSSKASGVSTFLARRPGHDAIRGLPQRARRFFVAHKRDAKRPKDDNSKDYPHPNRVRGLAECDVQNVSGCLSEFYVE